VAADVINGSTSPKRRVEILDDFRQGRTRVLCANIQTAGTAIDLSAASHGFFLELSWLPADNVQAAFRMVAMGKDEKVTADVATWPGSADDAVQSVLMRRSRELAALY
jgi:SNF2 family DNA or RNA helicase